MFNTTVLAGTVSQLDEMTNAELDEEIPEALFNEAISKQEVMASIGKLKSGKSSGPDKIIGEMLKHVNDVVIDFLVTLFNKLFDHGTFPQEWSKSIIVPIHKKGDVNQPDNYRGIALTSVTKDFQSGLRWKERLLRNKLVSEQVIALWITYLLSMRLYKNFYSGIQNCMSPS